MATLRTEGRALALLTAVVLVSAWFYSQFSLNHDTSWYLISTRMFLDGARLYDDIIEINPPLAFYVTIPSLILADLTQLRPTAAFFLYTSILGGISVGWVYLVALRAALERPAVWALSAGALAGVFLLPMHDFGQREHLMLILSLPYFAWLFLRERLAAISRAEAIALGIVAFFGLGLKPYFLLIPAGVVLARFSRSRDWREFMNLPNFGLGAALAGYLGFIVVVHSLYLETIVPTASLIYSAYGVETARVLMRSEFFALAAVTALALLCRKNLDQAGGAMLGGVAGAAAAYLVQFKGWNYQLIPMSFLIFLAAVWITALNRDRIRKHVLLGIIALAAVLLSFGMQIAKGPYPSRTTEDFAPFVSGSDIPLLVLSTNVSASFPFVNEVDARWTSRYPAQWLLPGAVSLLQTTNCAMRGDLCDSYRQVLSQARLAMVEDFARGRPQLVFVDDRRRKPYFGHVPFDYLPFLLQNADFAEMWRDYRRIGNAGSYQVWAHHDYAKREFR